MRLVPTSLLLSFAFLSCLRNSKFISEAPNSTLKLPEVETGCIKKPVSIMSSIMATPPPPHQLYNARLAPSRPVTFAISGSTSRKRKAEDDEPQPEDLMSASPAQSPSLSSRSLPSQRQMKRPRSDLIGRPLALSRLLETLDADSLRNVLQSICTRHPELGTEVENTAPKPSVSSALNVLKTYESVLQSSFPFGGDSTSDYAYNRVKHGLINLLDALADFTPHFLPPNESQTTQSLAFLDGATDIIHSLPEWSTFQNNLHKQSAYEEIARAWTQAIREAAKRAGGIQLQTNGWDQKISKHNQQSHGKLQEAMNELTAHLKWICDQSPGQQRSFSGDDRSSIRQELLSGTYGSNLSVQVRPW